MAEINVRGEAQVANRNPWLTEPEQIEAPDVEVSQTRRAARVGATAPQPGVPIPDTVDRLPHRDAAWPAPVWWLGAHGGAGESTLATLAPGTRPAGHAWPIPTTLGTTHRVVLVARSNYSGLIAAQRAATDWASGTLGDGVQLAGLVLIADAAGRRPKTLRDLEQVIGGGVPRMWTLPWVEAWRIAAPSDMPLPKEFRQLFADLSLPAPNTDTPH